MKNTTHRIPKKYRTNSLSQLTLLLLFIFSSLSSFAQEVDEKLSKELPIEKIYLHLDKSYYTAGEDVWFKAYLLDANTHEPSILSEILYVELIDTQKTILKKRIVKTTDGSAAGDFKLASKLPSGTYTVRAYTNYTRNFDDTNFYKKTILVNSSDSIEIETTTEQLFTDNLTFDTQFFPEGGYLVNGFLNPVAFKALDNKGNSISVSGKLIDDTGTIIKEFTSAHLGMGLFHFIPKTNRTYSALLSYANKEQRFNLPSALDSGVLMTVSNQPKHYKVELRGSSDLKMKDYRLIGKQNKGGVFNLIVNANKQEHTTIIKIAKDILEEGILELTLLNQEKKPIAERLLFNQNANGSTQTTITTNETSYSQRKLIEMEVQMDANAMDPTADLSLAVSNIVVNPSKVNSTDIKTQLLLSSVLSGEIEQPGYYFYSNNPNRQTHLDMLMRTQGWRQYVLDEELVTADDYFLPEKGLSIKGKVVSAFNENEPLLGSVKLTYDNAEQMILDEVKTNDQGSFTFPALAFTDTTSVLISANVNYVKKKRKETSNYKILLDSIASPLVFISEEKRKSVDLYSQAKEEAQRNSVALLRLTNTIELDEAFVAAKKQPKTLNRFELKRRGMPYKEPSQTIDYNAIDMPPGQNALLGLQARVPGLSIGSRRINIRGSNSFTGNSMPLILLDGIPIPITSNNLLLDDIIPLTANEIDFIDILKGPRAAIYGARASNGVIAIFTKSGTEPSAKKQQDVGSIHFKDAGYNYARNFYQPKYVNNQPKSKVPDYRTTLHWQPYIQLNDEGRARISFYSGDVTGDYQATIEGITATGKVITSNVNFEIINDTEYP